MTAFIEGWLSNVDKTLNIKLGLAIEAIVTLRADAYIRYVIDINA